MPLLDTLEAGTWYDLNFYLSLPEESCGIERIGAYFSRNSPYINTGQTLPIIQITSPGIYSVSISSPCAETSGETEVIVPSSCFVENAYFIPNIFSPNGDNVNDDFSLSWNKEMDLRAVQTNIFDRWGNLVFQSNDIHARWNGNFNGKQVNPGVYVYQIILRYIEQGAEQTVLLHGDVTLIR